MNGSEVLFIIDRQKSYTSPVLMISATLTRLLAFGVPPSLTSAIISP